MAAVGQNTFAISDSSQFTEFGFSRIPRGMHHWHMQHVFITPSSSATTSRSYEVVGTIDLSHVGPQIIEKFKVNWPGTWVQDLRGGANNLEEAPRFEILFERTRLMFTTSLPTELSALDKSVTPAEFDYVASQYRLIDYDGSQSMWMAGQTEAAAPAAGGGGAVNYPARWLNKWIEEETKPLVVSTTLVVFFSVQIAIVGTTIGFQFDTTVADLIEQQLQIDLLTRDHPMSNEDIWFARKLFNQGPENRLIYYRFANDPS